MPTIPQPEQPIKPVLRRLADSPSRRFSHVNRTMQRKEAIQPATRNT
jgi:hypothetical protein